MSNQPEALRLADLWEKHSHGYARTPEAKTAAELRRLAAVEAQRDALLEALKTVLAAGRGTSGRIILEAADEAAARAAIKAVEEGK